MAWLKHESAYDRRIRELEEEAERVRKSMQQLIKNAPVDASSVRGVRADRPASAAGTPSRSPRIRSSVDFRNRSMTPEAGASAETVQADAAAAPEPKASLSRKATDPEQFASYLASGSFGKPRSLSRERRLQRNKAIMMLIFALLAVYSLYIWMN